MFELKIKKVLIKKNKKEKTKETKRIGISYFFLSWKLKNKNDNKILVFFYGYKILIFNHLSSSTLH